MSVKWYLIGQKERRWYRKQIKKDFYDKINELQKKFLIIRKNANKAATFYDFWTNRYLEEKKLITEEAFLCKDFARNRKALFKKELSFKIKRNKDLLAQNIIAQQLNDVMINKKYFLKLQQKKSKCLNKILLSPNDSNIKKNNKDLNTNEPIIDPIFARYGNELKIIIDNFSLQLKQLKSNLVSKKRTREDSKYFKSPEYYCLTSKSKYIQQLKYVNSNILQLERLYNKKYPHAVAKNCLHGIAFLQTHLFFLKRKAQKFAFKFPNNKAIENFLSYIDTQEKYTSQKFDFYSKLLKN